MYYGGLYSFQYSCQGSHQEYKNKLHRYRRECIPYRKDIIEEKTRGESTLVMCEQQRDHYYTPVPVCIPDHSEPSGLL